MSEYRIKEMLLTLQGEGANTGQTVVLLRFEGCNRICSFCDTDFTGTDGEGGEVFGTAGDLAQAVEGKWLNSSCRIHVLCTGGEPLLQMDEPLISEFRKRDFRILVESNGTISAPDDIDWLCVSPKQGKLKQAHGDELKIVWPQKNLDPKEFEHLQFDHYFIQPMHDENYHRNITAAIEYCKMNPMWRLSLQTHRYTGIK